MKKQLLTTALILGLASAPVWAAGGQSFSKLDSDGDGNLTKQEAQAAGVSMDQADIDGNGKISRSEYQKATGSGSSGSGQSSQSEEEESGW